MFQTARNVVVEKGAGRLLIWSAAQAEINFHRSQGKGREDSWNEIKYHPWRQKTLRGH